LHCQTKFLGSLQIYHQLELGRLLDRNVGGLYAAQQLDELPGENVSMARSRPPPIRTLSSYCSPVGASYLPFAPNSDIVPASKQGVSCQ
jgi:hypothetical protein